jgi:hypothetical protein
MLHVVHDASMITNCYANSRTEQDSRPFKGRWKCLHGGIGYSEGEVMLDFLQDLRWETISEWQTNSVFVTLFVALALLVGLVNGLGWYLRGRKRRQVVEKKQFANQAPPIPTVRRVKRDSMEEQAAQLLRAIYDLAEGNYGQWVAVAEAAERADIPFTATDYYPSFQYLKQSGLITTDNLVYNEVCKLTPKGIRVMEHVVSSMAPADSMYSPKG